MNRACAPTVSVDVDRIPLAKWTVVARPHSSFPVLACTDCGFEADGVGRAPTLAELIAMTAVDSARHRDCHEAWQAGEHPGWEG